MLRTFLLLIAVPLFGQQPTISDLQFLDPDYNSVLVKFTVSQPGAYVQVKYGVRSGTYPWASESYQMKTAGESFIAIAGLAPNTTYYFLPVARKNAGNLTQACVDAACGAVEKVYTTPPTPASPVLPAAPSVYNPAYPDTSGYATVRIVAGSAGCQAAAKVTGSRPAWQVNPGDSLQKVLDTVGYGTIIEFDQGIVCNVSSPAPIFDGYMLSPKPVDPLASGIDDPKHRWILLRTRAANETDFPPFGFRTGPEWSSKMAVFKASHPQKIAFTSGQIFLINESVAGRTHHFWFDNFETTVDSNVQARFTSFFDLGNPTSIYNRTNLPDYFVFSRMYLHGPEHAPSSNLPAILNAIWGIPRHFVLRDSYIDNIDSPGEFSVGLMFTDHGTGPMVIDNNYLNCVSMGLYWEYNDTFPTSYEDLTVTHNTFYWPLSLMPGSPNWDGRKRVFRNQIETKRSRRLKIDGNLIDGEFSFQNQGQAIFISGTGSGKTGLSGDFDTIVTNNLIRHTASPFECMGVRPADNPGPPDNAVNRRVLFRNNLAYALGRRRYTASGGAGGLISSYFSFRPGCEDVTIDHNTLGFIDASSGDPGYNFIPSIFELGGGGTLLSGFSFTNNIYYLSIGNPETFGGISADNPQRVPEMPKLPEAVTDGSYKDIWNSFVGYTGRGTNKLTPAYTWTGNIAIGGKVNNNGRDPWPDMSSRDVSFYASQMPGSDTWVKGKSMAERERAAGLLNVARNDYTVTGTAQNSGAAGASLVDLEAAMGIVSDIKVSFREGAAQFQYLAPDSRACYIDVALPGTGSNLTWKRTKDRGGDRQRETMIGGLPSGSDHRYRILCYYDQAGPWFSFPSDTTNLTTNGTIERDITR